MVKSGRRVSNARFVRFTLVAAGLLTVGLLVPPTADAAVIYKNGSEPAAPRIGEQVVISVATFEADSLRPGAELDPLPLNDFLWTFVAESPGGQSTEIPLTRDGDSGHRWTGTFVFPEAGRWEIGLDKSHLGSPPDPALGARLEVVVGSEDDRRSLVLLAAMALILAIAVFAALWLRAREAR